ncbi:class I SAM-dependent methyltransferase [Pelolinea submarina]|uniref:Demethylmenaquinone methyltransferase/2-methoxy-6-polyprenyl-1,4-benzoquinol methylase n=1 Tax=Pelolinea submarina TaxID=913107 RepID=A0A3E0A7R8_9CHLR|nr:class I SAM-dependent methyltransferase [Pelolinea submarina]REG06996.1 demethylmenaquinone methyltransferase/2-methoxy-6-polyprenyl-1,4-benzoquinol methylase [Pelolinea submarina]
MSYANRSFEARVASSYDALSRYYDLLSGKAEQRLTLKALDMFNPDANSRMLDIGCGTGNALLAMLDRYPVTLKVTGLDISKGMCRVAQQKLRRKKVANSVGLYCANVLNAPFPDRLFDGILLSFTFELFPEDLFSPLLQECRRLLKPGGSLVLVSMAAAQKAGLVYRLYLWAHRKYPQWIDCRPVDAARILEDNGFQVTERETYNLFGLPVDSLLAI